MKKTRKDDEFARESPVNPSRRSFIKKTAFAALATAAAPMLLTKYARSSERVIKIGFVSPRTGPIAAFADADDYVLSGIRKAVAKGITVAGRNHQVQIIPKDSRSDPNRASEVASELIKSDKIDLMCTANTGDTVNPVSDQCELNGVPAVTSDAPWQAYFFGRQGDPAKGFDWTYHFFWGVEDLIGVYLDMWNTIPTNKVVGALWPNDNEGIAFSDAERGFPAALKQKGFKLIDLGRFENSLTDYSAQIRAFKDAKVEILTGVVVPPAFSTFWSQAAQQGFRPKIATPAKSVLFPASVNALGDRADGLTTEVWWSPYHPFKSGLTGQSSAELVQDAEKYMNKQWTQPMGFKHAMFEVAIDVLKRTKNIDSPDSVLEAIKSTNYNSVVGHVQWNPKGQANPVKNVCRTPLVGGQWVRGKKYKYDLVLVNSNWAKWAANIPTQAKMKSLA